MANRTPVGKSQAQASQPTVADLASKNSTDNPLSTGQTSEAPSKGLTAPAGDQSSSLNCEDSQSPDAGRTQDLAGIGTWADSIPESLEFVREAEDILVGLN